MGIGTRRLARGFALRLAMAVLGTFVLIGGIGYVAMTREMHRSQMATYAAAHEADARTLESIAAGTYTTAGRLRRINEFLSSVAQRPGSVETLVIDRLMVTRAAGSDPNPVGTKQNDPRVLAALRDGRNYQGHEQGPGQDRDNFEFVAPVSLPNGRHVFEASYDNRVLDANLRTMRRMLGVLGLAGLLLGGGMFYLVGGRSLLRSHRIALKRATRDGLTDLPNHRSFHEDLPRAIATAARHGEDLSLVAVDVDDFKFLNDREGHPAGDALLLSLAGALRVGRAEDRAYRIGGDEFAVILPHADADGARLVATRLGAAMLDASATLSIGVSTFSTGQSAEELRAEADAALYEAKRQGRDAVAHFEDIRGDVVLSTSSNTEAVRRLLAEGRVETVFQPIWSLSSGELIGIEALSRPDSVYGFAGPAEAFDVAERIGRVHELDVLCVNQALSMSTELPEGALLFVNLSPQTIDRDVDGNDWLRDAVERCGLTCDRVVIEVTERFEARTSSVVKSLKRLRQQGFKLAIDDVGTGNSGLEMLRRVGAEFVKIDRGIVHAAAGDTNSRAILMAMATYASQTGSFVIAEGIEDGPMLDFLLMIGHQDAGPNTIIHGGQGYGLGRPAPHVVTEAPDMLLHCSARRYASEEEAAAPLAPSA